jgi:hypothetical protein
MNSNINVTLYEGLKAPCDEILEFLDSLEFVPAQHDPRWTEVYAQLDNEEFYILVATENGNILGISNFTFFRGPFGSIVHANPYMGYGGCSCNVDRQGEVIPLLMSALLDWARDAGCITVSVGVPPFSERLFDFYIAELEPDHIHRKFYQYSYLDEHPLEKLKPKRRQAFASEIKRAQSAGIEIIHADDTSQIEAWLEIYEERYAQICARPLPKAFHKMLWKTFAPAGKARLDLCYKDQELLGGTLFLFGRGIVDYFSTAFKTESMNLYPGTLILYHTLQELHEREIKRFNWQSSPGRDSGVYNFKKRWGALEGEYLILTKVLGDAKVFTSRPLSEVGAAYGLHFVLPYNLWENK